MGLEIAMVERSSLSGKSLISPLYSHTVPLRQYQHHKTAMFRSVIRSVLSPVSAVKLIVA
jgi:hypothetical protein